MNEMRLISVMLSRIHLINFLHNRKPVMMITLTHFSTQKFCSTFSICVSSSSNKLTIAYFIVHTRCKFVIECHFPHPWRWFCFQYVIHDMDLPFRNVLNISTAKNFDQNENLTINISLVVEVYLPFWEVNEFAEYSEFLVEMNNNFSRKNMYEKVYQSQ